MGQNKPVNCSIIYLLFLFSFLSFFLLWKLLLNENKDKHFTKDGHLHLWINIDWDNCVFGSMISVVNSLIKGIFWISVPISDEKEENGIFPSYIYIILVGDVFCFCTGIADLGLFRKLLWLIPYLLNILIFCRNMFTLYIFILQVLILCRYQFLLSSFIYKLNIDFLQRRCILNIIWCFANIILFSTVFLVN